MIKTAPTLARIAIMAIFAFGSFAGGLYLWLAFGGSSPLGTKGYRIHVLVPEATQLADQSDVRISGVSVGRVVKLAGGPDDRSDVTLQLRARYAPLAKDSRAMLRTKTLLGETYVELTPGHPAKGTIPEGGTLPPAQVEPTVEIDEIMSTFDPATRKRFRGLDAVAGRGDRRPRRRHQRRLRPAAGLHRARRRPAAHARRPGPRGDQVHQLDRRRLRRHQRARRRAARPDHRLQPPLRGHGAAQRGPRRHLPRAARPSSARAPRRCRC